MIERGAWVKWKMPVDGSLEQKRQVGMIRFYREDGLDPRVDPEPEGTHLSRGAPGKVHIAAAILRREPG